MKWAQILALAFVMLAVSCTGFSASQIIGLLLPEETSPVFAGVPGDGDPLTTCVTATLLTGVPLLFTATAALIWLVVERPRARAEVVRQEDDRRREDLLDGGLAEITALLANERDGAQVLAAAGRLHGRLDPWRVERLRAFLAPLGLSDGDPKIAVERPAEVERPERVRIFFLIASGVCLLAALTFLLSALSMPVVVLGLGEQLYRPIGVILGRGDVGVLATFGLSMAAAAMVGCLGSLGIWRSTLRTWQRRDDAEAGLRRRIALDARRAIEALLNSAPSCSERLQRIAHARARVTLPLIPETEARRLLALGREYGLAFDERCA